MSKLLNMLMAGALALTLGGFAVAQNQPTDPAQSGATNTPPAMSEEGSAGKQAEGGATVSGSEQEYVAALKKCESLSDTDKTKCIDAAKKKHGQM